MFVKFNLLEGIHCIGLEIWFNVSGGSTYPGFKLSEENKSFDLVFLGKIKNIKKEVDNDLYKINFPDISRNSHLKCKIFQKL